MKNKKYYPEFKKGVDYTTEYDAIFTIPKTKEEIQTNYNPDLGSTLDEYLKFQEEALIKLNDFIVDEKITFKKMIKSPFTDESSFLKDLVPSISLNKTQSGLDLLRDIGLEGSTQFMTSLSEIQSELIQFSNKHGFPKTLHKPIISLISKLIFLKIRLSIDSEYGYVKKEKDGTITNTKNLLNKALRQVNENNPKSEFENETESQLFSEKGKELLKSGKKLIGKNKTGGYNMTLISEQIFDVLINTSSLIDSAKTKQLKSIYSLFRQINPEREMYKDQDHFNNSDEVNYVSFEKYQIGTMKTILGITR